MEEHSGVDTICTFSLDLTAPLREETKYALRVLTSTINNKGIPTQRTSTGDRILFGVKYLEEFCFLEVLDFYLLLESENLYHFS